MLVGPHDLGNSQFRHLVYSSRGTQKAYAMPSLLGTRFGHTIMITRKVGYPQKGVWYEPTGPVAEDCTVRATNILVPDP